MKSCELCKSPAKIYCDSDQASLCWTCDTKVHSANFLVARHSRTLLCRHCQSPTPWTAAGDKLSPSAVSVCEKCSADAASSSSSDDYYYSVGERGVYMKRKHLNEENVSEDDVECLSVLKSHRVSMEGNRGILYNFMPLNAEGMGDKLSSKCEEVIDECKTTRAVGFDLNLPDS
ncbi:hypothetical protein M8C21_002765 [Ambrosia artemisiifolia]|uniref:B box-type domain-containing protein n=1 Tax=Ambrosia artemisiifolia TaxID=4212 RepID=A0AAD5CJI3_AMBAR|nr:hypothetical protein M8C21_002765 [Ambrosia artemisiifolia]